jgi:hypothetical protein
LNRFGCVLHKNLWIGLAVWCLIVSAVTSSMGYGIDYEVETIEVQGSTRINTEQFSDLFDLHPGGRIDDDAVLVIRQRLLGLGVFRSAVLLVRKGSVRGRVKLILKVEDDPNILSDWGIASEIAVQSLQWIAKPQVDYRESTANTLTLLGRNLFGRFHRGLLRGEFGNSGSLHGLQVAYGWPRFSLKDHQFDVELNGFDPVYHYFETPSFALNAAIRWSFALDDYEQLEYGVQSYANRNGRLAMPYFPKLVVGPRIGYNFEDRPQGFFPSRGVQFGSSFTLGAANPAQSVLQASGARTWRIDDDAWFSLDGKALLTGQSGYSVRAESRLDFAITKPYESDDQALISLKLGGGRDDSHLGRLWGSFGAISLRYHSSAIIAEIDLLFLRTPLNVNQDDQQVIEGTL